MFPETSQSSEQCILPPVIYDVPQRDVSPSPSSLFSLIRRFLPAAFFRPVHFLLFSRLPPTSDSWRSLSTSPALLANLFSKMVGRPPVAFSIFPCSFNFLDAQRIRELFNDSRLTNETGLLHGFQK